MSLTEISENTDIFKCPVCGKKMFLENRSLICSDRHCFDISKKGHINLLLNAGKQNYDKELFVSRDIICRKGFFNPLIEALVSVITSHSGTGGKMTRILDAGCGEGFHLTRIIEILNNRPKVKNSNTASENQTMDRIGMSESRPEFGEGSNNGSRVYKGVGIDISKEGILEATKKSKEIIWCVADLAKIPLLDKTMDIILNILSPSNYSEFKRIISDNGILIKVVPGPDYLKELRKVFYEKTDKESYSNTKVIEHFERNFNLIDTRQIQYSVKLDNDELKHLIKMTPLSWGVDENKIARTLELGIDSITADFAIMVGGAQN
ncbi:MAG: hypothetical protein GX184_01280 [Clostridiaceae bacterium]|nr:hypothetical protein [Clostridiaceae bacterium]